jgi:hypothetical protein
MELRVLGTTGFPQRNDSNVRVSPVKFFCFNYPIREHSGPPLSQQVGIKTERCPVDCVWKKKAETGHTFRELGGSEG